MATTNVDQKQPDATNGPVVEPFTVVDDPALSIASELENHSQTFEQIEPKNETSALVCYGRHGKTVLWIGEVPDLHLRSRLIQSSELDSTTLYNYQNYAASEFSQLSALGALTTAGTIITAVMKPPTAKLSDVVGRAETYVIVVVFYVLSYVLSATSRNFQQYAGGYILYCTGQTGMQILNQILVADITSSRWRGLANTFLTAPFLVIPWLSAFIVNGVLNTIGWRWGIGMFAIIMPISSLSVIGPLLYFRRRAKIAGHPLRRPTTIKSFFTAIDIVGITLLTIGCAMFLLPMALVGSVSAGWSDPWVPTVMVIGFLVLVAFAFYEKRYATYPIIPSRYFKSLSLMLACGIGLLDSVAFQVTHTYLYPWSIVAHDFSVRDATFLNYTSGCSTVVAGLVTGFFMYRSRRYKWLLAIGVVVRLIGYGVMMRLRGANNPTYELFIVQVIQGIGSGIVSTIVIVIAQVVVPRADLSQATAMILLALNIGNAIGSAIAGGIYTDSFKPRLRVHLGPSVGEDVINSVFNSITTQLPPLHSVQRDAINEAYSDVLRYMNLAALVACAIPLIMVWILPNLKLNDKHNVSDQTDQGHEEGEQEYHHVNTSSTASTVTTPSNSRPATSSSSSSPRNTKNKTWSFSDPEPKQNPYDNITTMQETEISPNAGSHSRSKSGSTTSQTNIIPMK